MKAVVDAGLDLVTKYDLKTYERAIKHIVLDDAEVNAVASLINGLLDPVKRKGRLASHMATEAFSKKVEGRYKADLAEMSTWQRLKHKAKVGVKGIVNAVGGYSYITNPEFDRYIKLTLLEAIPTMGEPIRDSGMRKLVGART